MVVASCSSGGGDATPDLPAPSSEPALPCGGDVVVAAGERAARQADRDEPRLEAATPAVAKRVDGRVLHELDERGMRRLIIAAVDVVGEDGLRRPGPALCLADMAINRTAGVRWGLTCTEERPGALTVSGVGSLALGRVRAEHYFDVWGVAGDGVHRVEVVLADGSRHEAITDPGSPFTVHVSNKLLVAVSEVNARDATDEIVERVTATEKGTLPGFLVDARGEHP
jgi:hypothetical protein